MSEALVTALISEIREVLRAARAAAARQVNALAVLTNFEIGRRIVQHEQGGEERAEYGRIVVRALASELTAEFGRGFSAENLWLMRRFYLAVSDKVQIVQTASAQSLLIDRTARTEIPQTPSGILPQATTQLPFTLSWSHYAFLTGIDDPAELAFLLGRGCQPRLVAARAAAQADRVNLG